MEIKTGFLSQMCSQAMHDDPNNNRFGQMVEAWYGQGSSLIGIESVLHWLKLFCIP